MSKCFVTDLENPDKAERECEYFLKPDFPICYLIGKCPYDEERHEKPISDFFKSHTYLMTLPINAVAVRQIGITEKVGVFKMKDDRNKEFIMVLPGKQAERLAPYIMTHKMVIETWEPFYAGVGITAKKISFN